MMMSSYELSSILLVDKTLYFVESSDKTKIYRLGENNKFVVVFQEDGFECNSIHKTENGFILISKYRVIIFDPTFKLRIVDRDYTNEFIVKNNFFKYAEQIHFNRIKDEYEVFFGDSKDFVEIASFSCLDGQFKSQICLKDDLSCYLTFLTVFNCLVS